MDIERPWYDTESSVESEVGVTTNGAPHLLLPPGMQHRAPHNKLTHQLQPLASELHTTPKREALMRG